MTHNWLKNIIQIDIVVLLAVIYTGKYCVGHNHGHGYVEGDGCGNGHGGYRPRVLYLHWKLCFIINTEFSFKTIGSLKLAFTYERPNETYVYKDGKSELFKEFHERELYKKPKDAKCYKNERFRV